MIKAYALNAFTKIQSGGNPAAVVLNADNIQIEEMQAIAKKIGFSETAFIRKSRCASYMVNFFTPNEQVDLCGHATIALFTLLRDKGIIPLGNYLQETLSGILPIYVEKDIVFMEQKLPEDYEAPSAKEICDCLNINLNEINSQLPIKIVSTGLKDIIVPIKKLDTLLKLKPDFNQIKKLSHTYKCIGMHLFSLETLYGNTAHCRNFAPLYDIFEEAATGTSNGALACYLYNNGFLDKKICHKLNFEQGYVMERPSEIIVKLIVQNEKIAKVLVGGNAQLQKTLIV
ncbi:PhzF family phenazine biosynthesis protein [Pectinatus frisingensis]|uniref:PhzF family phenazine biosynthesis protein n=1 Tax=Pectinatus frisingensis TaxID=865 RepID=UPI001E45120D|nr:PhzF family phenazine biosynthesis protein [Pectinatus frisingensis]